MAFENRDRDNNREFRRDGGSRDFNRGGGRSFGGSRDRQQNGQQGAGNNGRIENFEKPLIQLLKDINEKLDVLIEKTK